MYLVARLRHYSVLLVSGLLVVCLLIIFFERSSDYVTSLQPEVFPIVALSDPIELEGEPLEPLIAGDTKRQLDCLADNIYYEAGVESRLGKVAVARVVMNRVSDPRWPDSPCKVVYQGAKYSKAQAHLQRGRCQFSWLCQGKRPEKPNPRVYREAYEVAVEVLLHNKWQDQFQGLTFYHGDYVNPRWPYKYVKRVGRHLFYKG